MLLATPRPEYTLHLEYDDGATGDVDVSGLVGKGFFRALADPAVFESVSIGEHGEVRWSDDWDLCADSLYLHMIGKSIEDLFPDSRAHADA